MGRSGEYTDSPPSEGAILSLVQLHGRQGWFFLEPWGGLEALNPDTAQVNLLLLLVSG